MRQSYRLREPVSPATRQHPVNGRFQVYFMADRYINRLYPLTRPQSSPDKLSLIHQRRPTSYFRSYFLILPHQNRLGTTNTRYVKKHSQMAGNTPSTRIKSGESFNFSQAAKITGASRKERSPGTYGKPGFAIAVWTSTRPNPGKRNTTTAPLAIPSLSGGDKSTPATNLGLLMAFILDTWPARRNWISLASAVLTRHS
ncbi:MAG: hypothetical protein HW384_2268 [Dehalococcoidia bacterium]|nr:hypothetical protein [Dehalococcoidia bacterium]